MASLGLVVSTLYIIIPAKYILRLLFPLVNIFLLSSINSTIFLTSLSSIYLE